MADYNEMFQKALELVEKKEYDEAAAIFYDIAFATGDEGACQNAIAMYMLLSWGDLGVAKNGLCDREYSLEDVNKAISLLRFADENNIEIDSEEKEKWLKDACAIKGIILSLLVDSEADKWLTWAEKLGDNQSRYWHIYHLTKVIKTADDDESVEVIERIKGLGEEYVKNYVPADADGDELRDICSLLAGLFEDEDRAKSRKYSQMAELFDEETKTVKTAQDSEQTKKKGIFGFRR